MGVSVCFSKIEKKKRKGITTSSSTTTIIITVMVLIYFICKQVYLSTWNIWQWTIITRTVSVNAEAKHMNSQQLILQYHSFNYSGNNTALTFKTFIIYFINYLPSLQASIWVCRYFILKFLSGSSSGLYEVEFVSFVLGGFVSPASRLLLSFMLLTKETTTDGLMVPQTTSLSEKQKGTKNVFWTFLFFSHPVVNI